MRYTVSVLVLLGIMASTVLAGRIEMAAVMNSAQEAPSPTGVSTTAAGMALLSYDDVTGQLDWEIAWQDLTGPVTGMHIHGPAAVGETAGVLLNLGEISGLTSPATGSAQISSDIASRILGGETYINVHTEANAPGEIRGQVSSSYLRFSTVANTAQEIPAPNGVPAGARADVDMVLDPTTNLFGWRVSSENTTGPTTGLHIHGPAGPSQTAGVLLNLGDISGLGDTSIGNAFVNPTFQDHLTDLQVYVNLHTAANAAGELRGNLAVPEPSAGVLCSVALLGLGVVRRRR